MKRIFALCLMLAVAPVSAQNVYKCIGPNGHLTLTSDPCPAGQRQSAVVHAPPEVMSPERREQLRREQRKRDADSAYLNRLAGFSSSSYAVGDTSNATNTRHAKCEAAKARRASARKAMGMKVSYLATRRLDEMVYDACK